MSWSDEALAKEIFGVPRHRESASVPDILDAMGQCGRWQSHLAWESYQQAALLHRMTETTPPERDRRMIDDAANTALHISCVYHLPKSGGDAFLNEALALIDRIPLIGDCLRDGIITPAQYKQLVNRTDLISDQPYAPDVDAAIADELRGTGVASKSRLHDMVDRIICRHDPDSVRHRRERAIGKRSVHSRRLIDGMAMIGVTATAEDIALAVAAVEALADSVCKHDPRNPHARRSDAVICRLQGLAFRCQCGLDDCEATTDEQGISDRHAQIVLHVIWEAPTPGGDAWPQSPPDQPGPPDPPDQPGPDGGSGGSGGNGGGSREEKRDDAGPDGAAPDSGEDSASEEGSDGEACSADADEASGSASTDPAGTDPAGPDPAGPDPAGPDPARVHRSRQLGFIDGYGVISADHVLDIASRPDTIIRPLNPQPGEPLAAHRASDLYRFSTALDTYIRARDGYCVFPGCSLPAWACDLDHVGEFDHEHPERGGQTTDINGNAKCRYHHIVKTFSKWLDDQYLGRDGLTHTEFITPDGYRFHTSGHTNEELFPALRDIRFRSADPPLPPDPETGSGSADQATTCDPPRAGPTRRRTRLADKHARRRHERKLNRIARERREDLERGRDKA